MNFSERALELVEPGQVVGLGTGRAATEFIYALGDRVRQGLEIRGVPTSRTTADLARMVGIPLTTLEEVDGIDIVFDGADEIDPQLNLIKGLHGALIREKIVAAAGKRFIVLAGPGKESPRLGTRGVLPVEVVPFALGFCERSLKRLFNARPVLRLVSEAPFLSDNGNYVLDCKISPLDDPADIENRLRAIPGIVGTGLFIGMAELALIQDGESVRVLKPAP